MTNTSYRRNRAPIIRPSVPPSFPTHDVFHEQFAFGIMRNARHLLDPTRRRLPSKSDYVNCSQLFPSSSKRKTGPARNLKAGL